MNAEKESDTTQFALIIEGSTSTLWGQIKYNGNLIVEEADSIETLEAKMKKLLLDFHNLDPDTYGFKVKLISSVG